MIRHPPFFLEINMFSIIDGNSLGYAAQSMKPLTVDGVEVQAVFGALKMLKRLVQQYPQYPQLLWLWDGRAKFRYELYPDYKGNRKDTPEKLAIKESYHTAQPYLKRALSSLGVAQVSADDFEADDLAGYFNRKATVGGKKSLLVTGDGDWMQLVNGLTQWHDPRNQPGKTCTRATFKEVTGLDSTIQFIEQKALMGDKSDNIAGVGGIGEKTAMLIIQHYGGISGLIKAYREHGPFTKENIPPELSRARNKINQFIKSNTGDFKRNIQLMDLMSGKRDQEIQASIRVDRGQKDFELFLDLCRELRFASIIKEADVWKKAFKFEVA